MGISAVSPVEAVTAGLGLLDVPAGVVELLQRLVQTLNRAAGRKQILGQLGLGQPARMDLGQ